MLGQSKKQFLTNYKYDNDHINYRQIFQQIILFFNVILINFIYIQF